MTVGRMKGESMNAYAGFQVYASVPHGERTWPAVLGLLGPTARPHLVSRWMDRWSWAARANEQDFLALQARKTADEATRLARLRLLEDRVQAYRETMWQPMQICSDLLATLMARGEDFGAAEMSALVEMIEKARPWADEALLLSE